MQRVEDSLSCRLMASLVDQFSTTAEEKLCDEEVTHLISAFNLGDSLPDGTEYIHGWKAQSPRIERAIRCGGAKPKELAAATQEVDQVVPKLLKSVSEILGAFEGKQ